MFSGDVACMILADRLRPVPVESGRISERKRHLQQAAIAAAGKEGAVEEFVDLEPRLVGLIVGGLRRRREQVMRGDDLGFPVQIAPLNRSSKSQRLDLAPGLGQLVQALEGQRHHMEPLLWRGNHQSLAS